MVGKAPGSRSGARLADVAVIVVSYNSASVLPKLISSIRCASPAHRVQLLIVDNASRDGSIDVIRAMVNDCVLLANATNVGFARANNQALSHVAGRYVLLLNTDAFIRPDTLDKTITYMDENPKCGVLGVRLVDENGVLQPSARYFPTPWNLFLARTGLRRLFRNVRLVDDLAWDHASVRVCDWVPGCFYLVRKEVIDQVGLFDSRYFLYYEEIDHCLAVKRAGWDVVFFPGTTVTHVGGVSARSEGPLTDKGNQLESHQAESELLYFRKNHGLRGVWANVVLTGLGDVLVLLKRLGKWQRPIGIETHLRHIGLVWSLFRRTRWGTTPTR